jgi:hypothetical protein
MFMLYISKCNKFPRRKKPYPYFFPSTSLAKSSGATSSLNSELGLLALDTHLKQVNRSVFESTNEELLLHTWQVNIFIDSGLYAFFLIVLGIF